MSTQEEATALTGRHLLIDGWLVEAGSTFPSFSPVTGEVLGEAPDATDADAEAAVSAARKAFDHSGWATDRDLRVRCLRQLHKALLDHLEELRDLLITEVGSPRSLTHTAQLDEPVEFARYYADLLSDYPLTEDLGIAEYQGQRHHRWIEKEAAGVVAAIVPYNFPIQLALAKLAPALAAGCTVVMKAPPDAPLVMAALGELIASHTEIPAGVVNVLTSSKVSVGELLTTHPDVDVVSFTGSTATGRRILAAASETIKRVFLELGGKSALIVLDDADLRAAAIYAAFGICLHSGQGCALNSRVLVPRAKHDEFAALVAKYLGKVNYGDPADPKVYMGPLISERQRDKVDSLVRRAVDAGATLVTGGERVDPGFYYKPTLLANVAPDAEVAQNEVFGPVLAMIPYDDEDDAVRIANDTVYGLSGAIYTTDENHALELARRIRTGTFSVNGGSYFFADIPFGGYKQSGIGREKGVAGLEEFLESKAFGTVA